MVIILGAIVIFLFTYFVLGWSWWLSLLWLAGYLVLQIASERHPKANQIVDKSFAILALVIAPFLVWFGNDDLAAGNLLEGILVTLGGMALAAYGSYNVWIKPKKRSKLWLLFSIFLPGLGYIPLAILANKRKTKDGLQGTMKMTTIRRTWENILNPLGEEGLSLLSIGSAEEAREIIDAFFLPDKINPLTFWGNCEALLRGGHPSLEDLLDGKKSCQSTPSLSRFTWIADRPVGMPLWFIAAYPDVLLWYDNQVGDYMKAHRPDEDSLAAFSADLFGLDPTDPDLEERLDSFVDKEGKFRPNILRKLVESYKDKIGKVLETAVKSPAEDIYLGAELCEALGAENNWTLIAMNTTKYYLELTRSYHDSFKNEVCLLAAAGVLDAISYVMEQTITPSEVFEMAERAAPSGEDALLDFIISLEIKIFSLHSPSDFDVSDIEASCLAQKGSIADAIERTKRDYVSEPMFAEAVSVLIHSHQFSGLRRMLGITDA